MAERFLTPFADDDPLREAIRRHYHADESECVAALLAELEIPLKTREAIGGEAGRIVARIREENESHGGLDAFLQEFKLSSEEGVALMCLAEALLRVPDADTADQLIQDKLADGDWGAHLGESESFFVNASTWGLMLTGKIISLDRETVGDAGEYIGRLVARSGEPIIRTAVRQAMRIMGRQFVLAETIQQGLQFARDKEKRGYCYSYDMLGEAARTAGDAEKYYAAYRTAIDAIGGRLKDNHPYSSAGISVKLSALHPRYEFAKEGRIMDELYPRLRELCAQARGYNIGLTIDAEEADRLDPSLSLLALLAREKQLKDWQGLGFVVQAYQKRAPPVIDWIASIARDSGLRIMVRLVKGAYWDTEIKKAQIEGYASYPVFTRKIATDVSYLACARRLLAEPDSFYPLFATHNAHTVASVLQYAGDRRDFEFQCLHGMGEILYDHVIRQHRVNCRIYAPVGPHRDLLAYLVRRLLENGANSSFVNRLVDRELPIERIVADPIRMLSELEDLPHPNIPVPRKIYPDRANSRGLNLADNLALSEYFRAAGELYRKPLEAGPLVHGADGKGRGQVEALINPASGEHIGVVANATPQDAEHAIIVARRSWEGWDDRGGAARAEVLRDAADRYEAHRDELLTLCIREAGKTLQDAVAELREAVDFLRYYALMAERDFAGPDTLTGPTGELNQISLHGRGVFLCISPWNFPLAIFTGQVSAALAAGNAVLAKPAEQTPAIAFRAVQLLHQAGVPEDILQLLPGDGAVIGDALVKGDIDGVAFTGSNETADLIQRSLSGKAGPIVPFIAETGGINAMIVDSTALPEQVIRDAVQSAFQSAGQRCSALRALYLQEDIADEMLTMLRGSMAELKVGDPAQVDTDIGPIIDRESRDNLADYIEGRMQSGVKVYPGPDPQGPANGYFLSPAIIELSGIADMDREIFGPVLHVCRFRSSDLDQVVDDINRAGYGLTFGIHSRIQSTVERISRRIKVGNIYVNRNTIGAVVGVQPFGGEGLSGTGPKAGGPRYLHRFAVERSVSTDTTAAGGNTSLLSLEYL